MHDVRETMVTTVNKVYRPFFILHNDFNKSHAMDALTPEDLEIMLNLKLFPLELSEKEKEHWSANTHAHFDVPRVRVSLED